MNKKDYKMMAACLCTISVILLGAVGLTMMGYRIIPTTTQTTTTGTQPGPGTFYTDKAISGNTENNLPDGVKKDGNNDDFPYKVSAPLKFTESDVLTAASVSGSGSISLYDYVTEGLFRTYTFTTGSVTTSDSYTSGQHLRFKVVESGYVTYYGAFTVPWCVDNDPSTIDIGVKLMDLPAAYTQSCFFANDTEVTDAMAIDVSEDADAGKVSLILKNQQVVDDDGYWNSYNFLADCWQKGYFLIHVTGTGTDSVIVDSTDLGYDRIVVVASSDVWLVWELSDDDMSRDLLSDGVTYDPTGRWQVEVNFDLSGITSGDSVTCTYGVYWYADAGLFRSDSQWAPSNGQGSATDTFTIIP